MIHILTTTNMGSKRISVRYGRKSNEKLICNDRTPMLGVNTHGRIFAELQGIVYKPFNVITKKRYKVYAMKEGLEI